jgi:hypothetical protein
MPIPKNGRVVVIDDNLEEEALPLLQALAKQGVAVSFFKGEEHSLPAKPINGVRLLFLDIKLAGMEMASDDEIAKSLKAVIETIIDHDNGPYVMIGWTKHSKYLTSVVETLDVKPVHHVAMEKSECQTPSGVYDLTKIEAKLSEELTKIGPVRLLFEWENLINDSAYSIVNEITESTSDKGNLESVLFQLAKADIGKMDAANAVEISKSSLHVFNMLLADTIESKIGSLKAQFLDDERIGELKKVSTGEALEMELRGKINSKLLISSPASNDYCPGNVYSEFDDKRKDLCQRFVIERIPCENVARYVKKQEAVALSKLQGDKKEQYLKAKNEEFSIKLREEMKLIFVEVTPVCDHAQGHSKYHRIMPGFLLNTKYKEMLFRGIDLAFYESKLVYVQKFADFFILQLDFRGLTTIEIGSLFSKEPLFRLRQDFLFDIQHKAGTHFSRPGYISLP